MKCPSCDHENIQGHEFCDECGLDLAGLDVEAWGVNPEEPALARPLTTLAIKQPITLAADASVNAAVKAMREHHQGCVFIVEDGSRLLGVFTERDVAVRVAAPGRDPLKTAVGDVMTHRPVALRPDDPLAWALHRMGVDGYRHLPLVDDGRLVGLLSVRIVLEALATGR